jgi:hypothetical protein
MRPLREPTAAEYLLLPVTIILLPLIFAGIGYGLFVLGPRQIEDLRIRRVDENTTVILPPFKPERP